MIARLDDWLIVSVPPAGEAMTAEPAATIPPVGKAGPAAAAFAAPINAARESPKIGQESTLRRSSVRSRLIMKRPPTHERRTPYAQPSEDRDGINRGIFVAMSSNYCR